MNSEVTSYPSRSYENVDPFEINDTNHVIRIGGVIKAQLGTGAELLAIKSAGNSLTISTKLVNTSAPQEWPVGTKINLCFNNAKVVPNPVNEKDDELTNVCDIDSYGIFEPNDVEKRAGYPKGIQLGTSDGIWDLYYDTAEVIAELPNKL